MNITLQQAAELNRRPMTLRARRAAEQAGGVAPQPAPVATTGKRIRQNPEPLMNILEEEWYTRIKDRWPTFAPVRIQAVRFRLSRSSWYRPDFTASLWPQDDGPSRPTAWEVKGPRAFRGGLENLKVAASLYPEWTWLLVWKEDGDGEWKQQRVLP